MNIPLVLHGGTGIKREYIQRAIENGISKVNIATAIRQPYEKVMNESVRNAQKAVYDTMINIINEELNITGIKDIINPEQ